MKNKFGILFVLFLSAITSAQQTSNWENYTNLQTVQAMTTTNNGVWAATSGGGFSFDPFSNSFKTLHRTDGLTGINLTAVTVDTYGKVWFGSKEGVIDIYNPVDNSLKSILDIYNSNYSVKQITELKSSGDTIFVSTSYGISLINAKTLLFIDTFFKFGNLSSNIQVNSTLKSDLLYACTVQGLAIQKQGATNLSAPESWNVYSTSDGLPSASVNKVVLYNGSVIVGTGSGLAIFNGTSWQSFLPQLSGNINDLLVYNDSLFILSGNLINVYSNSSVAKTYTLSTAATLLSYSGKLGLLAASTTGVIEVYNSASNNTIFPDGPGSNQFPSLAVDNSGTLWCASGQSGVGKGFYKYNGENWANYNLSNTPSLLVNDFHVVYSAPDNSVYLGSWGFGYIKVQNDSIKVYTSNSTGMKGAQNKDNTTDYLVVSGFGVDSKNNLWVLNYGGLDLKTLNMITPDNTWYHYYVPSMGSQYIAQCFNLVVDQYDTKWFNSKDANRAGLFYFNENGSYTNSNPINGFLTTSDGLTSNTISSIVMDMRGDIWVGTSLGVNVISGTENITSGYAPSITSIFSLRQYTINCLAVDPINQKWVGTNQGLLLVNSDGSELLATYNTKNSSLLSDNISSLAIDKNKGIVYVGTDQGLTSFKTSAIEPKDSFTKLFIYPSPFVLKSGTNRVTIDGLIRDSDIKIITLNGKLVKEFSSPGGRVAYWDGTNSNGNLVSTGVYLVVAYDQDGNNVVTGKIAVIRQ